MDENRFTEPEGPEDQEERERWRPKSGGRKPGRRRSSRSRSAKRAKPSTGGLSFSSMGDLFGDGRLQMGLMIGTPVLVVLILFFTVIIMEHTSVVDEKALQKQLNAIPAAAESGAEKAEPVVEEEPKDPEIASFADGYEFAETDDTKSYGEDEDPGCRYFILVDVDKGQVVAKKDSKTVIPPASMTKILTLLVAVENLSEEQLEKKYEFTSEVEEYAYANDCSVAGFETGEKVPVKDLLYGLILPSGADAAMGLCDVVAGGLEPFMDMMNEKCEDLEISKTAHFTNPVGIYDEDLHCTAEDMAKIMKAALENKTAREVLHAHQYTTSKTKVHPDGISLSNKFLRRIEDEETPGEVYGAKTGFVNQSGNCAASYLVGKDGGHFICVTVNSPGAWNCIYCHRDIYNTYIK